jgi:hypothetical protein
MLPMRFNLIVFDNLPLRNDEVLHLANIDRSLIALFGMTALMILWNVWKNSNSNMKSKKGVKPFFF